MRIPFVVLPLLTAALLAGCTSTPSSTTVSAPAPPGSSYACIAPPHESPCVLVDHDTGNTSIVRQVAFLPGTDVGAVLMSGVSGTGHPQDEIQAEAIPLPEVAHAWIATTPDGGSTWNTSRLPTPVGVAFEENVYAGDEAFAPDGTLHVVGVATRGLPGEPVIDGIVNPDSGDVVGAPGPGEVAPVLTYPLVGHWWTKDMGASWGYEQWDWGSTATVPFVGAMPDGTVVIAWTDAQDGVHWRWSRDQFGQEGLRLGYSCRQISHPVVLLGRLAMACQSSGRGLVFSLGADGAWRQDASLPVTGFGVAGPTVLTAGPGGRAAVVFPGQAIVLAQRDGEGNWTWISDLREAAHSDDALVADQPCDMVSGLAYDAHALLHALVGFCSTATTGVVTVEGEALTDVVLSGAKAISETLVGRYPTDASAMASTANHPAAGQAIPGNGIGFGVHGVAFPLVFGGQGVRIEAGAA